VTASVRLITGECPFMTVPGVQSWARKITIAASSGSNASEGGRTRYRPLERLRAERGRARKHHHVVGHHVTRESGKYIMKGRVSVPPCFLSVSSSLSLSLSLYLPLSSDKNIILAITYSTIKRVCYLRDPSFSPYASSISPSSSPPFTLYARP